MSNDDLLKIHENKEKKDVKKILLYAAVAFLVFVIGVVVFALYKNSSKEESILPPEVKKEPLFKEIPVEKKELKEDVEVNSDLLLDNENKNSESDILTQNLVEDKNIETKENIEPKEVNSKIENKSKKVEVKELKEDSKIEKKSHPKYYIQVAALLKSKEPDKKFLELIKKDGFNYEILKTYTTINNHKAMVTKILIGPFSSKEEAKKSLIKVKKFIAKNAFIIKVK